MGQGTDDSQIEMIYKGGPLTRQVLTDMIAEAIARQEGFRKGPDFSKARRNNNPGNLRSWGKVPVKNGFCVFPCVDDGWKALKTQIRKNIDRDLTFQEFFGGKAGVYGGYAPAADANDPQHYAKFVVACLNKWLTLSHFDGAHVVETPYKCQLKIDDRIKDLIEAA